jgi:hypothetical protein
MDRVLRDRVHKKAVGYATEWWKRGKGESSASVPAKTISSYNMKFCLYYRTLKKRLSKFLPHLIELENHVNEKIIKNSQAPL